ncbi:YncE family protein [Rhodocaloribacter sp.]
MTLRLCLPLAALCLFTAGCDLFGSDPPPSDGFYLYIGNWSQDEVFVIDTNTNEVVRTLRGFNGVWTHTVSHDGRTLYVGTRKAIVARDADGRILPPGPAEVVGGLYAVDTRSWRIRKLLDRPVNVFPGPPGLVAFVEHTFQEPGQPVGLIDTRTNTLTFLDTLDIAEAGTSGLSRQGLVFHPSRPIFYTKDTEKRIFAYDYERRTVVHTYASTGSLRNNMTISRDGRYLYVAGGPVLDLERDSVVAWVGGNVRGSVGLSPSGDTLYVSDPGVYLNIEAIPSLKLFLFDTRTNTYMGAIDVGVTADFALTPDGHTAYVSGFVTGVFIVDLVLGNVSDMIEPGRTDVITYTVPLTLGPKP